MPARNTRVTQEEFLERAIAKHGFKFNYSKAIYISYSEKVCIFCNQCSHEFWMRPSEHLSPKKRGGCPACWKQEMLKATLERNKAGCMTKEEFLPKARAVHADRYDYSDSDVSAATKKTAIKCNTCSKVFSQTPSNHLKGTGCPFCARERCRSAKKYTQNQFLEKAAAKHPDKYDYSLVNHKGGKVPVKIICRRCGDEFLQTPNRHLAGSGCIRCGVDRNRLTTEEFVRRANELHEDSYGYSEVKYTDVFTKVKIFCNGCNHFFMQKAHAHLSGQGCPSCASNAVDPYKIAYVYKLTCAVNGKMYVGVTSRSLKKRLSYHLTDAVAKRKAHQISRAIQDHGRAAFVMELLETLPGYRLPEQEQYWIDRLGTKYPNGYNVAKGGCGIMFKIKPVKVDTQLVLPLQIV